MFVFVLIFDFGLKVESDIDTAWLGNPTSFALIFFADTSKSSTTASFSFALIFAEKRQQHITTNPVSFALTSQPIQPILGSGLDLLRSDLHRK